MCSNVSRWLNLHDILNNFKNVPFEVHENSIYSLSSPKEKHDSIAIDYGWVLKLWHVLYVL